MGKTLGRFGAAHQRVHRYLPTCLHTQQRPDISANRDICGLRRLCGPVLLAVSALLCQDSTQVRSDLSEVLWSMNFVLSHVLSGATRQYRTSVRPVSPKYEITTTRSRSPARCGVSRQRLPELSGQLPRRTPECRGELGPESLQHSKSISHDH